MTNPPETAIEVIDRLPFSAADAEPESVDLVADWLASKSKRTRRAYAGDLARFAVWAGAHDADTAVRALVASGPQLARRQALAYRGRLEQRGLSPATINRALSALRSVVDLAQDLGVIEWTLNVKGLKSESYKDTRGPTREQMGLILQAAASHQDAVKAARDDALLRLLYALALRREEAVTLDVRHLDIEGARVAVLGKRKHERQWLTVPKRTLTALQRWLEVHPDPSPDRPLFVCCDHAMGPRYRLTGQGVFRVLAKACEAAGIRRFSPHGLRHAAITHALDLTNGDVRRVQRFSRHKKLETLQVYDDNRRDSAGDVANLVEM